jgi:CRISPR/Cas system-associated exonuclease Cas4 (RecB family)
MLHGVIDVVERRTGGDDLRVTDHKTGVNRTRAGMVVGGGETLQPVLYGLAVEAALQKRVAEARLFFCTPVGGFAERTVSMTDEVRRTGVEVLRTVDRAIEAGFLPPAPRERACTWCDFLAVCGPSAERRAKHKDPVPLGDLRALRKLP